MGFFGGFVSLRTFNCKADTASFTDDREMRAIYTCISHVRATLGLTVPILLLKSLRFQGCILILNDKYDNNYAPLFFQDVLLNDQSNIAAITSNERTCILYVKGNQGYTQFVNCINDSFFYYSIIRQANSTGVY